MIHVAIVEDDAQASALLQDYLKKYSEETGNGFQVSVFKDALSFLDGYAPEYQLIFMDIKMPGIDGMEAARRLRALDDSVQLIFVTNMAQYAIKGYEVRAMDFIIKPVEYSSFFMKMKRVMRYIDRNATGQITIKKDKQILRLEQNKLLYVEVRGHNLEYHTEEGIIETRGKMSDVEESLKGENFSRCNNCYLVNLAAVKAVRGLFVTVGEDELRISRSRKAAFMNRFTQYLAGGTLK